MIRLFAALTTMAFAAIIGAAPVADVGGSAEASTQRAESIAFRLAAQGVVFCPRQTLLSGIAVQILDQFTPRDRPSMIAQHRLDRGARVIAVASGSPAAAAGVQRDDIILAIGERKVPTMADPAAPFDQKAALAALDAIDSMFATAAVGGSTTLTILRGGAERTLSFQALPGCPSLLHVARSDQRNAYADGVHILLPTGIIDWIEDDDQLALLIAHEMAHNILAHAAAMRAAPRGTDRHALLRQQEDEADVLGARLARAAGYDLLAGSKLFPLISNGIELFPVHRNAKGRIALTLAQAGVRAEETPRP